MKYGERKYPVVGIMMKAINYNRIINLIFLAKKKITVAPIATHPIIEAHKDSGLRRLLNEIDFVLPDSQYVRFALYFLHGVRMEDRIYGPELFMRTLQNAQSTKKPVYLCGNKIRPLLAKLRLSNPHLIIAGTFDLSDRLINEECIEKIQKSLNDTRPSVVFIGLGSPVQHVLMKSLTYPAVYMAVGAAFDFVSGAKKGCPSWIGDIGLEWLYRFLNEPRRLWKRYLIYAPWFMLLVMRQKLKMLIHF